MTVLEESRRQLADAIAIERTADIHAQPDDRDLRAAEVFLRLFPERGPCPRCLAVLHQVREAHRATRGPLLACECGWTGSTVNELELHTRTVHGREPTRQERTPKGQAA